MHSTFPRRLPQAISAGALVELVDEPTVQIKGDPATVIETLASLDEAISGSLAFCSLTGAAALTAIQASRASVLITQSNVVEDPDKCFIVVSDSMRWFVRALHAILPSQRSLNIHPTAIIHPAAEIGEKVSIGAHALIAEGVVVGDRTIIGADVVIEQGVQIGHDCVIGPHSTIGVEGLAVAWSENGQALPFTHLGRVLIGSYVRVGSQACIVRGILKDTSIADGCQIGNQVNVGHNVRIGESAWISSQVVLCGSVLIEDHVKIGAKATINNHVTLKAGAFVGLGAVVTKTVQAGKSVFGVPAKPIPTLQAP